MNPLGKNRLGCSESANESPDENDPRIAIENNFVVAEDAKGRNPGEALRLFEQVVHDEEDVSPDIVTWRFKALRHIVEICLGRREYEKMITSYEKLLSLLPKVTANEGNEAVVSILDQVAGSRHDPSMETRLYDLTLRILEGRNERLWFTTQMRQAHTFIRAKDATRLAHAIEQLHASCRLPSGEEDFSKATYLMEVYALKIQLGALTKDFSSIEDYYERVQALSRSAIEDPHIQGVVRETFGQMHMQEQRWYEAYQEFFEAFKGYQQAGNPKAVQCLKYVILANMVASMEVDPFDSQEAKAVEQDPEIQAMVQLRNAYGKQDMRRFEAILGDTSNHIADDAIIQENLAPLMQNFRSQVALKLVRPYHAVRISYLAGELNIGEEEMEHLLVGLILDGRLVGALDQVDGVLRLSSKSVAVNKTYSALSSAVDSLERLRSSSQLMG